MSQFMVLFLVYRSFENTKMRPCNKNAFDVALVNVLFVDFIKSPPHTICNGGD